MIFFLPVGVKTFVWTHWDVINDWWRVSRWSDHEVRCKSIWDLFTDMLIIAYFFTADDRALYPVNVCGFMLKCQKWTAAKFVHSIQASALVWNVRYEAVISVEWCCSEITMLNNHDGQLFCAVNNYKQMVSSQIRNKLGSKNLLSYADQLTDTTMGLFPCQNFQASLQNPLCLSQHHPETAHVGLLWKVGGMWGICGENKLQIIWLTVGRLST